MKMNDLSGLFIKKINPSNKNGIKYNKTFNSVQNRIECVINNKDATSITDNAGL